MSCTLLANCSLTVTADVEPVTEHNRLPLRSCGPLMPVSSLRISKSCPATKYGPAKETTRLRSSVMEYVARIMSTSPFCSIASRCLDGASFQMIWSSEYPKLLAMYLATSTSKPTYVPDFLKPKPGWSNLMPMRILPASSSAPQALTDNTHASAHTAAQAVRMRRPAVPLNLLFITLFSDQTQVPIRPSF